MSWTEQRGRVSSLLYLDVLIFFQAMINIICIYIERSVRARAAFRALHIVSILVRPSLFQ